MKRLIVLLSLVLSTLGALASDHADPAALYHPEAGITDLFFYPHGDDYIVMLNVFPKLKSNPPFEFDDYEYVINFDLHTKLSFDVVADKARYGGTVMSPEGIKADASIRFSLMNDVSAFKTLKYTGLTNESAIRKYTGIRDDPFIFPRFFGSNVVAAVFAIPKSSFPAGQQDFIIYGEAWKDGDLVDTVGRSNRSQNGRFQFLVDVPANEQKAAIQKQYDRTTKIFNFLNRETLTKPLAAAYESLLELYPYDLVNPDVMIYSNRFPVGYPNGRLLTDDVAYISCQYGDCALVSLSYAESPQFPRATRNDRDFLPEFPFLAEPWPAAPPMKSSGLGCGAWLGIILAILFVLAILWWFISRLKWKKQYPTLDTSKIE
jgi:hypothetical protein